MLHVPGKLLATASTLSRIRCKALVALKALDASKLFATETVNGSSEVLPVSIEDLKMAQASDG